MKLSDAILKGCEISPKQVRGQFFKRRNMGTCALGAAYVGFLGSLGGIRFAMYKIRRVFQVLNGYHYPFTNGMELAEWITIQNDTEHRTREQIAVELRENGL